MSSGRFVNYSKMFKCDANSAVLQVVEDFSSKIDVATPMQIHEVIDGHHRDMIRYRTAQDAGYRKVVSALRDYLKKLDKKHDIERACK